MTRYFLTAHPLDLHDEGIEDALALIAGEIGADALSITAIGGESLAFRPRLEAPRRLCRRPAGAHFQADARLYQGTRLRPTPAAWVKSRDPLSQIAGAAERRGVALRCTVAACENAACAERYPLACVVDAFGRTSDRRLCVSNPEFREFVAAVTEDLSQNYPTTAVELAGIGIDGRQADPYPPASAIGWSPTVAERELMTWCFCGACATLAKNTGLDVTGVRDLVVRFLEDGMNLKEGRPADPGEIYEAFDEMAAFHALGGQAAAELVREVKSRCRCPVLLRLEDGATLSEQHYQAAIQSCDRLVLADLSRHLQPETLAGGLPVEHIERLLRAHPTYMPDGPSLVGAFHEWTAGGCSAVGAADFGILPDPCLDWVRQAIRFARREAPRSA